MSENNCINCRYVSAIKRPKIIAETGFDDQLEFEDVDETVYLCRAYGRFTEGPIAGPDPAKPLCAHAGKEIGLVPITCEAWSQSDAASAAERLAQLDRMIADREARIAAKEAGSGGWFAVVPALSVVSEESK